MSATCPITFRTVRAPPKQVELRGFSSQRAPYGSTMDSPTVSTDSKTGDDHGKTLVSGGLTALTGHPGKISSYPVRSFSESQTMNSHNSGSAAPTEGSTETSEAGQKLMSKGLNSVVTQPAANSVIQTPVGNSQNVAQPTSHAAGPTVTLARPPMQSERSGTKLNGNNNVSPSTSSQGVGAVQTPAVNNNLPTNAVSVSTGLHVIKAEPPQAIQTSSQLAVIPGAPRNPGTVAAVHGGVRALTPQALAPRLPLTSPGQPSVHNIQIPPGGLLYFCHLILKFNQFELTSAYVLAGFRDGADSE